MKKQVWNIETGEMREVEGVDAREYVATGGWSLTEPDPVDKPVEPEPAKPKKRSTKKAE